MKKLILWNVVTLDGYFEGVEPWDLRFHETVWGEEFERFSIDQLDSADAIIYGGVTYAGMADYWAKEQGEVADRLHAIKKYVCSHTLLQAEWNNTKILRDAVTDIGALKESGEGNLFVFGSGKLTNSLIKAGLFDEYRLCIAPVILGDGRQLFEAGLPRTDLLLLSSHVLTTNGVVMTYGVKG
jgi:dihydrofolate reductase